MLVQPDFHDGAVNFGTFPLMLFGMNERKSVTDLGVCPPPLPPLSVPFLSWVAVSHHSSLQSVCSLAPRCTSGVGKKKGLIQPAANSINVSASLGSSGFGFSVL